MNHQCDPSPPNAPATRGGIQFLGAIIDALEKLLIATGEQAINGYNSQQSLYEGTLASSHEGKFEISMFARVLAIVASFLVILLAS